MIEIHISNNTDTLIQKICEIIKNKPLINPLQEEIFIIDNKKVAQWIKISIATKLGISANIKCFQPFEFLLKTFQHKIINCNDTFKYHNDTFLFWKILKLQENYKINIDFIKTNDSQSKKINFALHVSKMFQKYLIYRPNWINYWNSNINIPNILSLDQVWQKKLWYLIKTQVSKSNFSKLNFMNLLDNFLIKNQKNKKNAFLKESRIIIFGMHQLNNTYLSIFSKISNIYKVILVYYSPYSYICQNISYFTNEKSKHKKNINNLAYVNPILKNFAKSDLLNLTRLNTIQKNIFFILKKKKKQSITKYSICYY